MIPFLAGTIAGSLATFAMLVVLALRMDIRTGLSPAHRRLLDG